MVNLPVLTPDVEVSVKLRRYFLTIPGEPTSFAYTYFRQAIEAIVAHGFGEFVLHVEKNDYLCRPAQQALFEDHRGATCPTCAPADDTPNAHQEKD